MEIVAKYPNGRKHKSLHKEQAYYKQKLDTRQRKPRNEIPVGSFLLQKEHGTAEERKYKLSRLATGPHQLKEVNEDTILISRKEQRERVSRGRVELTPIQMDLRGDNNLKGALKFLQGVRIDLQNAGIGGEAAVKDKPQSDIMVRTDQRCTLQGVSKSK